MPLNLDLTLIEKELYTKELGPSPEMKWLSESYKNPAGFWEALYSSQKPFLPLPRKSVPFKSYDFYYDIITCNLKNTEPALRWYDSLIGWQEISYSDLGELASRKTSAWIDSGVQAGQKLCIIYPLGLDLVVSLMAAFKVGLVVSLLPPLGSQFLQRRLETLAPDHIDTDDIYFSLVQAWLKHALTTDKASGKNKTHVERSYAYPSGSVAALCFDPSSKTPHIPKELTSDALYLNPLRDGNFPLGLQPGKTLAAPGFHFLETQPGLVLACLLNGGTYLHIEPDDVYEKPDLLLERPLRAMGVTGRVRNVLLENPVDAGKHWDFWFKTPAESQDIVSWQAFIETLKLKKVLAGNLKWEASLGGCSLFSLKYVGQTNMNVLPCAGLPWCLTDVSGSNLETATDYGVLSVAPLGMEGEKTATLNIIAKDRNEWYFIGSQQPSRAGRFYPLSEVLETLLDLPFGSCGSIVEVPASGSDSVSRFVLLVFLGARTDVDKAEVSKKIHDGIEVKMGKEFLPDSIRYFSLYPKRGPDGAVDHDWCRFQYLTGALFRKSRQDIFTCLTLLREHIFNN
jgi:hypothetical protein